MRLVVKIVSNLVTIHLCLRCNMRKMISHAKTAQIFLIRRNFHEKPLACRETFREGASSIPVRPSLGLYKFETEKKPRGGSRGAILTRRFFRRLVQKLCVEASVL